MVDWIGEQMTPTRINTSKGEADHMLQKIKDFFRKEKSKDRSSSKSHLSLREKIGVIILPIVAKLENGPNRIRLRDLMVPFYEMDGLRIVRILDYDIYFAIKDGNDDAPAMIQFLKEHEVENLQSDPSYASELDSYPWKTLEECDYSMPQHVYKVAIEAYEERSGKTWVIPKETDKEKISSEAE